MFMSGRLVIRETLVTPGEIPWERQKYGGSRGLSDSQRGNGRLVGRKAFRKNMYERTLLGVAKEGETLERGASGCQPPRPPPPGTC